MCHFTRVLRERKLLRQNVTTEACDTRKSGTMLSQYQRKQGPMLYLVRVLGDNGRSLSFLLSEKTKKRIYRGDQLLFISIPTKSGTVETEVSLKRCGPPNGAEGERNGAFDQPTLSGFSLLRYGVLLLGKTSFYFELALDIHISCLSIPLLPHMYTTPINSGVSCSAASAAEPVRVVRSKIAYTVYTYRLHRSVHTRISL